MKIVITASGDPIYQQIGTQIKEMILKKELQPGDMLPSIRLLAKELRISVITTKRAYEELEREGFLETVAGKGCFIRACNEEAIQEEGRKRVETSLAAAVKKARQAGLPLEEIVAMLRVLYEEDEI